MASELDVYILLKLGRKKEAEEIAKEIVKSWGTKTNNDAITSVLHSLAEKLAFARVENALEEGINDPQTLDRIKVDTFEEILALK